MNHKLQRMGWLYHRLLWRENKAKGGCRLTIDILDKDALAGSWQLTKILALR